MQTEVYRVGFWAKDEDFPTFPVGSQPKELLICPEDMIQPPLIPRHKYLFKTPRNWQAHQTWSEIVAYYLGCLCDVPVPPAYLAVDQSQRAGVLVEFFFGHPGALFEDRFVHGSDLLQRSIRNKKAGRPHGVRTNVMLTGRYRVASEASEWGRLLVFDALIGNTDRHPDNWGVVWRYETGRLPQVLLAPAFDNATSLGYEIPEPKLTPAWDPSRLARYVGSGLHHCGWSAADDNRGKHVDLCVRFLAAFPHAGESMRAVLRFDPRQVSRCLDALVELGGPLPLTPARARFMYDLVVMRRDRLSAALEV